MVSGVRELVSDAGNAITDEAARELEQDTSQILDAVRSDIERRPVQARTLRRYLPGFRGRMLRDIRRGETSNVSLVRALQLARAVGLQVDIVVRRK